MVSLIAGLGNPGERYAATRHNAGFWFIDLIARRYGANLAPNKRFSGDFGEVAIGGERVRLVKPSTFMNLSGQSVAAVAKFYKIPPESVLVVHDEIDLPAGVVRLKQGGGEGGHNGLRDISPKLGSKNYLRLRLGVGHPGASPRVINHVLDRPRAEERRQVDEAMDRALEYIENIVRGDTATAMNDLNRKAPAPAA